MENTIKYSTRLEAKYAMDVRLLSKKGAEFAKKNNIKKRIGKERIFGILYNFVSESLEGLVTNKESRESEKGDYLEYYLLHSDDYPSDQVVDYVKFFNTIHYITSMIGDENLKDCKLFTISDLLQYSNAKTIFEYSYKSKKFQEWQDRLFEILTLQNLSK